MSSGYENDKGIEPTNDLWRYTGRANVTLTGGKEKPATLATIEQIKAFLSKKSNGQFVSGKIELTEVK